MPKISIVTTTYKHEKFIRDTIESILSQSYTDWELLIGDDSPDDNSWKIIEEYTNKYPNKIRAWHHNPNKGIVGNMNFLIEQASKDSEYITFLEGDDLYTPDNLEEKMKVFEKYPNVGLIHSNWSQLDDHSTVTLNSEKLRESSVQNFSLRELIEFGNPIKSFSAATVRKSLLYKAFPFESLDPNSLMFGPLDYSIWVQIIPGSDIFYIQEILFLYRVHAGNYSKSLSKMNKQIEHMYRRIIRTTSDKDIQKIANFFIEHNATVSALFEHNRKEIWIHAIRALKYNPTRGIGVRLACMTLSLLPWKMLDFIPSLNSRN